MFWYGAMIYLLPVWMKLLCTHTHTICLQLSLHNCLFPSFLKLLVGVHFWLFTLGNFSWESNCVTLAGIHATAVRICWWALQRDWWEFMFIHSHGADIYSEDIYSMGKRKFVLSILEKKKQEWTLLNHAYSYESSGVVIVATVYFMETTYPYLTRTVLLNEH